MYSGVQTRVKLQDFITASNLEPSFGRKLQKSVQLGFDLHGGVSLAAALSTPEISRTLREEVLVFALGGQVKVHCPSSTACVCVCIQYSRRFAAFALKPTPSRPTQIRNNMHITIAISRWGMAEFMRDRFVLFIHTTPMVVYTYRRHARCSKDAAKVSYGRWCNCSTLSSR